MSCNKVIIEKDVSEVVQNNYYWFKTGFNDDDISKIIKISENYEFNTGTTFSGIDENYRRSKVKWLSYNDDSKWLYDKIFKYATEANNNCYKFRLHYLQDSLQYTFYDSSNEGKYDWHLDIGKGSNSLRKLSGVILLNDTSEFEGGLLQMMTGSKPITIPLEKGSVVFFPSFILHRVTPVTKGKRISLVFWIGGDHYI